MKSSNLDIKVAFALSITLKARQRNRRAESKTIADFHGRPRIAPGDEMRWSRPVLWLFTQQFVPMSHEGVRAHLDRGSNVSVSTRSWISEGCPLHDPKAVFVNYRPAGS